MIVSFDPLAWEDYLHWQRQDQAINRKINGLIKKIQRHPFEGTGKPEPLKGSLTGFWSRRINREHRLVYRIKGNTLETAQCRYHY